jgi:hypothetical protein
MAITSYTFLSSSEATMVDAEIASGVLRLLKNALKDDVNFWADYAASVNPTRVRGTVTTTPVGAPTVSGGKLVLTGGGVKYVDYDGSNHLNFGSTGAIRVPVTPNYSGTPSAAVAMFAILNSSGSLANVINLYHNNGTGQVSLEMYNSGGGIVVNQLMGVYAPTSGVEDEWELNVDVATGATRLFKNGTQFGATITSVFTRAATPNRLRIGGYSNGAMGTNISVGSAAAFSAVQHAANYSAPSVDPLKYDTGTARVATPIRAQLVSAFTVVTSEGAAGSLKYGLEVDGVLKYFNGTAWVASDGTAAQLSTASQIVTGLPTLLSKNSTVYLFIRLTSTDGTATPSIDEATLTYLYGAIEPGSPSKCNVFLFLTNAEGVPVQGATVTVDVFRTAAEYLEAGSHVIFGKQSKLTDVNGYVSFDLIRSSAFESATPVQYRIVIEKASEKLKIKSIGDEPILFSVTDGPEELNLTDLVAAA